MKKMLLATALFSYYRMCSTNVYCSNRPAAVAPKKPSPIISSFLELGRKEAIPMQPKFVAAQKMLLKQKPRQTFVNGLLSFITLGIYTPLGACVLLTIIA